MKTVLAMCMTLAALPADAFELLSQDVAEGKMLAAEQVFKGFGCEGGNLSPALKWRDAPEGTKSFAVTVYDPDAPTGSGWWHWTVFNIPRAAEALPKGAGSGGALPLGAVQGRTDFGSTGFGGACPPAGAKVHRYQFTVWALNTEQLPLDEQASGALVGFMLNAHAVGKATITAIYGR
jgi:Raf kinase inhibitor-like YbhB/YbcL family protein